MHTDVILARVRMKSGPEPRFLTSFPRDQLDQLDPRMNSGNVHRILGIESRILIMGLSKTLKMSDVPSTGTMAKISLRGCSSQKRVGDRTVESYVLSEILPIGLRFYVSKYIKLKNGCRHFIKVSTFQQCGRRGENP